MTGYCLIVDSVVFVYAIASIVFKQQCLIVGEVNGSSVDLVWMS